MNAGLQAGETSASKDDPKKKKKENHTIDYYSIPYYYNCRIEFNGI
jgi:hypothetical protein